MKKTLLLICFVVLLQPLVFAQQSISVNTSGKGEPILFLPGFATPGEVWNTTASNLPQHSAHIVTYAGFGGVAPVEMPWYEKLKTDLIGYITANSLENLTLVGHSMGGNLALDLAASLPDRIQKIVIVDALSCMREIMMPGVPAEALAYESPYNDQLLNMDEAALSAYLTQMTQNMITKTEDQALVKNWMAVADRKTFVYGYTDLLKLDSRPLFPSIKAPVLLMVAGQPYGPGALETMKKQYNGLKNTEFVLATESKHYLMLDQQEWFITQLNSFLNK
ncbi:alpha/beta fold hydrolase [Algoriphagus antarcticus]|nr:alpha/beta hydrolase [Algoriphagus antarcticus]